MEIKRDFYLRELIEGLDNGLVKIVTGIRRCGKSYLLDPIFKDYLLEKGIKENHIIKLDLDERENFVYHNPDELNKHIKSKIIVKDKYYVILDEVQMVKDFESVLIGLLHMKNVEVYVTGCNSKFLSSDIITEFRGRGHEIKVYPLSFSEFYSAYDGSEEETLNEYYTYGGLPLAVRYLKSQKDNV